VPQSGGWVLANASDEQLARAIGVVSVVHSSSLCLVQMTSGRITRVRKGLTPGKLYYLSPTQPGQLVDAPPVATVDPHWLVPCFYADTVSTGIFTPCYLGQKVEI